MKRTVYVTLTLLIALAAIRLASNAVSADDAEGEVRRECEDSIAHVTRLWRLPPQDVRRVPASSLRERKSRTVDGETITHHALPDEEAPFCYAYAAQAAPFVLRVEYGWAARGPRMTFGHGGERIVVSLFGKTATVSDRPEWYF